MYIIDIYIYAKQKSNFKGGELVLIFYKEEASKPYNTLNTSPIFTVYFPVLSASQSPEHLTVFLSAA